MNDTNIILDAIGKSTNGFNEEVKKLTGTVHSLNVSIEKLNVSMDYHRDNHSDLKDNVNRIEKELSDVVKEVDQLKVYGEMRFKRGQWWSSNWMNILKTVIICVSAISFVVIAYTKLTP